MPSRSLPLSSPSVIYMLSRSWLPLLLCSVNALICLVCTVPSESLWHNHHQKGYRCFLAGMTWFHSQLNIPAPSDGTASLAVMLPRKAEKWDPPLELQGCLFLYLFCGCFRSGLFHLLFALHLDMFSQWVLKKWLLIKEFKIAEALNRVEWSSHSSHMASGGLSNSLMSFSMGQCWTSFPHSLNRNFSVLFCVH